MPREASPIPLYAGAFVLALDTAGAGHLFPALEVATHAPPHGGSWFLSIYMLGALLGAPLLARVASRRGRTRVLAGALAAFALASVVVGFSSSYPLTLAARFAQGVSGSPIMPLGAAQLGALAPSGKKGRELGLLSLSYSAGFLAGMAFVSLFLLLSFRIAYLFSGALAAAVSIAVARLPPAPAAALGHSTELPTMGAWVLALGLTALAVNSVGVEPGAFATRVPFGAWTVRVARAACVPALLWFVWYDRLRHAPLLPRDLFRSRLGVASAALAVVSGIGQACVVVLPACGMSELGVSAAASGPLLIPIVVGGVAANVLVSARLDRWGPKPFLLNGVLFIALGNLVTAQFGLHLMAFELGALLLGTGVSSLSSGALRYLATLHGSATDAEANQAAVSLLTNVGVLLGGSLWGALVASTSVEAATVRVGLFAMTAALLPMSFAVLLVPAESVARAQGVG